VFDVEHVAEMLGVSGEEAVRLAESALRAGLLRVAGAGYEFANAVIREVLYDTTPMPTRVMRHRRLAALLRDRPAEAAEHAAAAGDRETAVDQWLIAGEAALAVFANREAEAMLTRALDACTLMVDPVRTARVQLLRGRARLNQTRYEDAELDLAGAQALARAIGDAGLEQSALEQLGWCAYYARQIERAGELAERALRQPAASARTQVLAGRLRHARGDLSGAIETLSAVAEEATDAALRASATSYLSSVLAHSGRFDEAVPMLDDAADACRLAGLLRPMFNALFFSTMARANRGDLGGALTAVRTLAAEVERYEYHAYRPRTLNLRSWLRRELGDAVHAQDLAQQGLEATLLPDGYVEAEPAAHSRLQLAESALQVGDVADAARWLAELADTGLAGVAFGWRVELHWLEVEARLESARAEELLARADERGSLKYRALALAHMGRRSEALEVASATGSALLVAHVADDEVARRAAESVAATLPVEDRNQFMEQGAWRGAMT
jgi:tetratricopeptide (TPR) repeat protein